MNKKKFALMAASAALVASTVLFGTLAYFTDRESVANTFTVGNVNINLDEAVVDENGNLVKEDDTTITMKEYLELQEQNRPELKRTEDSTDPDDPEGNEYKLVPGKTYVKDPTMTVAQGSEPAYVRMKVTISHIDVLDDIFAAINAKVDPDITIMNIFNGHDNAVWEFKGQVKDESTSPSTITYEFRYRDASVTPVNTVNAVDAQDDITLEPLFESFTVPGYFGSQQIQDLKDMTITVVGEAIQSDTFADEDEAWGAFETQMAVDSAYSGTTQP